MFKSKLNEDDFPDSELRYTPITENVKALPSDSWMVSKDSKLFIIQVHYFFFNLD